MGELKQQQFRLLQVDDRDDEVVLLEHAMRRSGLPIDCAVALDGEDALRQLVSANSVLPNTVLLDIEMPKITGFEVLSRIRHNATLSRLPVVMFSSSSHEQDIARSRKLGANAYVVKPTELATLTEFVAALYAYGSRSEPLAGWCEFMKAGRWPA